MTKRRVTSFGLGLLGCFGFAVTASAAGIQAGDDAPWDRRHAAHLLARAGFGGPPAQIDALVELGRDGAVGSLLDYASTPRNDEPYPRGTMPARPPRRMMAGFDDDAKRMLRNVYRRNTRQHMEAVGQWWLRRMMITNRPLEEKMTLFWHGHFTSGFREVKQWQFMYDQNELLREHALGDFKTLLVAISKDPAMLRYLDNANNVKRKPNENYARELMELFTLGEGNYTEKDVKEAARALTGWGLGHDGFQFKRRQHDDGKKDFLGRVGNFDGEDIISIILEQPAASRYLARRLWTFFAYRDPEPEVVEELARVLRDSDFSIRAALRAMLRSDAFYSDRALSTQIKSPIDVVVGSVRRLEIEPQNIRGMFQAARQMGQALFQPPNVKGWDGGRTWITTNTLFTRYNFAGQLLEGMGQNERNRRGKKQAARPLAQADAKKGGEPGEMAFAGPQGKRIRAMLDDLPDEQAERIRTSMRQMRPPKILAGRQQPYDPMPTLERYNLETPEQIVRHYVGRLIQGDVPKDKLDVLIEVLSPQGRPLNRDAKQQTARRVREMIFLIMSMPEYQLI